MDSYQSAFERLLRSALDEIYRENVVALAEGAAPTIEAYRERVGFLRALRSVDDVMIDIRKKLEGRDDNATHADEA
jgi:hypothetical protein